MKQKYKGIVRAAGTHFQYENGEWFYPFGTTVYGLIYQPEDRIRQTMETLKRSPFNKVRMCVFPKFFDYNREEPKMFPFKKDGSGDWDMDSPCPAFWNKLERNIRELDQLGIQCDLILMHPYDKWGFSRLTREQVKKYLEYTVRRLAPLPNIWWSLANEYDIMMYTTEDWEYFARVIRENDPYGHLLSNHNMVIPWDFSNPDTTHICLQLKDVDDVSREISRYGKPLIVDECCYEGNIPFEWGNISAFELVNRFWKVYAQGGYASHGETFLSDDDVLWWSKGGLLKGESPERICFLKHILESLPGPLDYAGHDLTKEEVEFLQKNPPEEMKNTAFVNLAGKVNWEQIHRMMLDGKVFAGKCQDNAYLYYYGRHCTALAELDLPEDHHYTVDVIDVWNMTSERRADSANGHCTVNLPGKEGIAVLARKCEAA